jgi:endonuclease/exonuclease/phosphatase family metal-dependent hydrolase
MRRAAVVLVATLGACDLDPGEPGTGTRQAERPPGTLRLVTGNLSTTNDQDWDGGQGIRIIAGVSPDVAMLQELNVGDGSREALQAFVDANLGPGYHVAREEGVRIPNGVVSRFPIREYGIWNDPGLTDRELFWARLDVPGERDLWAVSVHLHASSGSKRVAGARAVAAGIQADVPADDFVVIGGDFNTGSLGDATFGALAGVVDVTVPRAADADGNPNTSAGRSKPLDQLLVDDDLQARARPLEIGDHVFPDGLVVDTRRYRPIADLAPAQAGDSGAPSMQHMAVVRDFDLPGADPGEPDAAPIEPDAAPIGGGLMLNEILANEPGSSPGGEFVELVNTSGAAIELGGWTLSDRDAVRHTFAAGTRVNRGSSIVVFGATPAQPGPRRLAASTGALSLNNGSGDTVRLRDADGVEIDALAYPSNLSSTDGVSMTRQEDGLVDAVWRRHIDVAPGRASSPNARIDGTPYPN